MEPVFYYDINSPYAYLAGHRVDDVLPVEPRWQPIAFGALVRQIGKRPWSLTDAREEGQRECERRAAERGLPLVWTEGWPVETHSMAIMRALLVAEEKGRQRELARAAWASLFGRGEPLVEVDVVAAAATEAGLDGDEIRKRVEQDDVKEALKVATEAAIDRGVTGIPTVAVGDQLFHGDDRLEDAAAAISG